MNQEIFAVYDRAAQCFGRPLFTNSIGQTIRSFIDEINREDKDSNMWKHPDDFDLYQLGSFDDVKGKFHGEEPKCITMGKDVKIR
jgi:hypothetical protein